MIQQQLIENSFVDVQNIIGQKAWLNACPAELFHLYFSLFEAGIANAISSFKWQKI